MAANKSRSAKAKPKARAANNKNSGIFSKIKFSNRALLLYAFVFAAIGGYVLWKVLAATNSYACFAAPAGSRSSYNEPRAFMESQTWWLDGSGDPLTNINDAMRANHIHLGLCYPQGETLAAEDSALGPAMPIDMVGKLHNFVNGTANFVRGGLVSANGGEKQGVFWPPAPGHNPYGLKWHPTSVDETMVFPEGYHVLSDLQANGCGREEGRYTLNSANNNQGVRQYESFGLQTYIPCKAGQSANNYRGSDLMIFRGWYEGGGYVNVNFADESAHSYTGFHASDMDDPVPANWTVRYSLSQGATRSLVMIDPDIHHGSYGLIVGGVRTGTGPLTVTIPSNLSPGVHKLAIAGCEQISSPRSGQSCVVGVVPFTVGGSVQSPPPSSTNSEASATVIDDSYVRGPYPQEKNGSSPELRVYKSANLSYLKVRVANADGPVNAMLHLHVIRDGSNPCVHKTSNDWDEATLQVANKPAVGDKLACSVQNGNEAAFDLGNLPGNGDYSFVLTDGGSSAEWYGSKDSDTPPVINLVSVN